MKLLPVVLLVFYMFLGPCNGGYVKKRIVCEHHRATIACPQKETIKIMRATYGRSDYKTCPHSSIKTNRCSSKTSFPVVSKQCNGRQACKVTASNILYGDPCVNTYKYLSVIYKCEKAPQIGRLVVCEGKKSILRCPSNKVLKISRATYGRTDRTTCPHPSIRTTKCSTSKPLPIITRQCEGRQTCIVASTNSLYGDPCVHTYKYLTVNYECTGNGNCGNKGKK